MSDSEDQQMLEEIRALENALSRNTNIQAKSEYSLENLKTEIIPCAEAAEEAEQFSPTPESAPFCNDNLTGDSSSSQALQLNKQLIVRLLAAREEVAAILEECKRKKEIIDRKLQKRMKSGTSSKLISCHAGMPYFKGKDFFSAPPNDDTKLKEARGELQIIHLRRVSRWTAKDKVILLTSIHSEVAEELRSIQGDEKIDEKSLKLGKNNTFPEVVLKAIGPLGNRDFDWMKIAATDFQNKHSSEECRVMWNIFLHPDINKFKWKKKEMFDLEKLVKQYKSENWDLIARKLGTQRSGYQCFVKFNTMKKLIQNEKPWSKQEDKKLVQLINKFKIGDFINWGDVASCVKTRTKHQVYFRWMYSLAPHLKKGRFTEEEDRLLLNAIDKYGPNFKKISALVLPARTSAQLSDHFSTLANKDDNVWTVEQDLQLVSLHKEHGKDWSKIATFFDNKTRVQLRHRYSAIARYEKRGLAIEKIPRSSKLKNTEMTVFQKVPSLKAESKELDDVDVQIIQHFQTINVASSKAGRKQKFYSAGQLQSITRRIYNILHMMSANICIPYDLDEYECLTEKDKQILFSLKNLPSDAVDGAISRNVEDMRQRMFPSSENQTNHFVPPLPFGGQVRSNKSTQMINYSLYIDTTFVEKSNMVFETPQNIVSVIGEETSDEFDKIAEILVKNVHETVEPIEKIYILRPGDLGRKEITVSSSSILRVYNLFQTLPTSSRTGSDLRALNFSTYNDIDMNNFPSMKPNYWTLLGYQAIQRLRRTMRFGDEEVDVLETDLRKVSEKGRKALALLRIRLVQLFKYPIIMSQIMPPESIDDRDCIFLTDDEIERVPSVVPSVTEKQVQYPSRKRKRIKEEQE